MISPLIYKNIGYDPLKAFTPIARICVTSNVLVANPKLPFKTLPELIAYAKANAGKLNYSSAGIGTPPHLIGEMFKLRAGIDGFAHVVRDKEVDQELIALLRQHPNVFFV